MLPSVISNRGLALLSIEAKKIKYFSFNEVQAILSNQLKQKYYDEYILTLFLWRTGARISEALACTAGDLDLQGGTIKLVTLKQKKKVPAIPTRGRPKKAIPGDDLPVRYIPANGDLIGELGLYIARKGLGRGDKLFPICRKTAYNQIKRACEMSRIGREDAYHPHTLRHSFSVNCLTQRVPITVLMRLLGHSSLESTLVYSFICAEDTREIMSRVQF